MEKSLDIIGTLLGIVGVLVCLLAGVFRFTGNYYLLGFETVTLFIGGIAIMVAACFAKLHCVSLQMGK